MGKGKDGSASDSARKESQFSFATTIKEVNTGLLMNLPWLEVSVSIPVCIDGETVQPCNWSRVRGHVSSFKSSQRAS